MTTRNANYEAYIILLSNLYQNNLKIMKRLKKKTEFKITQEFLMESEKPEFESKKKTKKMTAHSYKTQFKPQRQHVNPLILDENCFQESHFYYLKPVVNDKVVPDGNCLQESFKKEGSTCSERTKDGGVVSENDVKSTETTLVSESASYSHHAIRTSVCSVRKRVNSDSTENDNSLGWLGTCKKRAQYSNESPRDKQELNIGHFIESSVEYVSPKLPVLENKIGVKSPSEEHGRSETDVKISELERKCLKRQKKLQCKQMGKILEFHKIWDEKREQLDTDLRLEIAVIRSVFREVSVRTERLKRLDEAFASKIDKHNLLRDVELKNLEAEQLAAMNEEKAKADRWLTAAKTRNDEPIAVYAPPLIDETARVTQLEINSTIDTTTNVSESVEQIADKKACESESTLHCQDKNFNENDSLRHLDDRITSERESTQHLEDQNPSESVYAKGNAPAPASTSISTGAYPVHCHKPTEMRNLIEPIPSENLPPVFDPTTCRTVESVCANGNASAPASTSISTGAYPVHCDKPTEMRNLIEPIPSENLPPVFDPTTCRTVFVGNLQMQVTEQLLQDVFAITGPVESCKLVRKPMLTYGFVQYFDRRSALLAIQSLNGSYLYGMPIKVDWRHGNGWADTSSYYNIFVGGLGFEVTDTMLYAFFSVYPSCSYAMIMRDKNTRCTKGFGFVSFRSQQEAQSAIDNFTGKWLGSKQIYCNWGTKGANAIDDKPNPDAPENNPQCTTVFVGNLASEVTKADLHQLFHALCAGSIEEVSIHSDKGFGFVRYSTHDEAALAISVGNEQFILNGILIRCKWGTELAPPPMKESIFSSDLLAYVRHLAMSRMGDFNALNHPAQGQFPFEQGGSIDGTSAGESGHI